MRKILLLILCTISSVVSASNYYVSPTGDDNASGDITHPWQTWKKAFDASNGYNPGDTIYFRGGVYYQTTSGGIAYTTDMINVWSKSGRFGHPIVFMNYPGEVPILDCSLKPMINEWNTALSIYYACFIELNGLTIRNVFQPTNLEYAGGINFWGCGNITLKNLTLHTIGGRAIGYIAGWHADPDQTWQYDIDPGTGQLYEAGDTARFINLDIYNCCDSLNDSGYEGGGADGIKADNMLGAYFYFEGNRIWHCSDDAVDVSGPVLAVFKNCWHFANGGLYFKGVYGGDGCGFKLNGQTDDLDVLDRELTNCISAYNTVGFEENIGVSEYTRPVTCNVFNNTTFANSQGYGNESFHYGADKTNIYRNNLSYKDTTITVMGSAYIHDHNSWDLPVTVTDADFISVDYTEMLRPRKEDGSLPDIDFLKLASTSDLIDAGTYVGLPFSRTSPDLGAFEYSASSPNIKPVTSITVTGSEGATTITTNKGTLQLFATVLPSDATNKTVRWTVTNGTGQATISSSGVVTAVSNGIINARATANDGSGVYGTLSITISNQVIPVTSITVTGAGGATTISTAGGTLQLSAAALPVNASNKTVTWTVTNGSGQATINSTGLVTAIADGTVTARATSNDGSNVYGTLPITISSQVPVTSITVTGAGGATTIATDNGTLQLSANVLPANATNKAVTWSISSGTDKASISSTGLVTALDNGTATARATANDGSGINGMLIITISNQIIFVNTPPVIAVNFLPSSYSGFVYDLDASGSFDSNKDNLTFSWQAPSSVSVSSTTGPRIKYLSPMVSTAQTYEFTLNVSDGKITQGKVISINVIPYKPELDVAEISNIEASNFQAPYYPYNIIDGNIGTMWSADGDNQWLIVELKKSFSVQHVKLAFQPGQRRESYFDILGSTDKLKWEPIMNKSASCSFSGDLQVFEFPPSKTGKKFNYIKLVGHGNSTDTWNYISELKIFGYRYRNFPAYENLPVKVYPNPAREFVTIRIDEPTLIPGFIQLIDLSGKVVIRSEVNPDIKEFTIPINLRKGIYIVQLGSGKLTLFTQKLVVS